MKVSVIIGNNIKALMEKRKISQRKFAEIIGVTHPTLGKYINGEKVIDSEKLSIVADFFDLPFDYFFTTEHKELSLLFRADKPFEKIEEFDFKEIKQKFQNYIDVVELGKVKYIPPNYNLQDFSTKLSDEEEDTIEKIAYEVRRIFNIEHVIPNNYFTVVEEHGINVISSSHRNESFFGASSYSSEYGSFIFVNSHVDISEERQIFSMFHELGHLLFNRNEYMQSNYNPLYKHSRGDINEKIVDKFSGYFLLPRYLLKDYIDSRNKDINIIEMKNYFKVSIQALYIALKRYNYISDIKYKEFWNKVDTNGWKKVEPKPLKKLSLQEKNNRLINSMKRLFINEEISVNRIAEVLEISSKETRMLVKSWGGIDEQYERF